MSRHSQPHPSGGWLSLVLAVVAALGGASIASNVAAGPGRVAIGWATVLAAAVFLLQYRWERRSSLRLARIDHARRRDAVRLREELGEAHQRSRLAVERSYAAVARSEALALEVAQLMAAIRATPAPVHSVQVLPMMTSPPAQQPSVPPVAASTQASVPGATPGTNGSAHPGTSFDLPLVTSKPATSFSAPTPEAPAAAQKRPPAASDWPDDEEPARVRVDLRAVEPKARFARGA